ncbi:ribosome hibernation factor-recruiting GTPase MRF [Mycolicibacterium anyangense]|uniref:ribosome hibernation factor-recruiting GTPase MRF n=1 Tax=Mycolicibacterium anyangense TaxID=1431246 RepID=UPI0013CFD52D|nr:GTP-binding protein [Mycolicibacterium anyangense]
MRTPVLLVAGQGDTDALVRVLLRHERTLVVRHRFDGHVVRRLVSTLRNGILTTAEAALELAHGCVSCTVRKDLLVLLRRLHRRDDVDRIVVHLDQWLEPEPICWAINHVRVQMGPGYTDGPAARDVEITGVITAVDTDHWLAEALGDEDLDDGRTVAQVAVGQVEFADIVVAPQLDTRTLAVLRRLAPRAWIIQTEEHVQEAVANLDDNARRGTSDDPCGPLLAGQPPLDADGDVGIVEFEANRPFHPLRLHDAIDVLFSGVVRTRGRLWLASQPEQMMYLESAGGGLRVTSGGKWLAAMDDSELAYVETERRALSALIWDEQYGDRHTSMAALACGADPAEITTVLAGALLTDDEMADPQLWAHFDDPFGDWHEDPCDESVVHAELGTATYDFDEER